MKLVNSPVEQMIADLSEDDRWQVIQEYEDYGATGSVPDDALLRQMAEKVEEDKPRKNVGLMMMTIGLLCHRHRSLHGALVPGRNVTPAEMIEEDHKPSL